MTRSAPPRPASVTILALGVLTLAALYLTRIEAALRQWDFLQNHALPGAAWYLLGSGLVWSALFLPLGLGLWRGAPRAGRAARPAALGYALAQWGERLYLHWRNAPAVNHPFWLLVTLLGLGWVFWLFSRPGVQIFFGELHER